MAAQPVWNPSDKDADIALTNSNATATLASGTGGVRSTVGVSSGKWYVLATYDSGPSTNNARYGVATAAHDITAAPGATSTSWVKGGAAQKISNNTFTSYGLTFSPGDVVMLAVDMAAGKVWAGEAGTWYSSGDPAAGTGEMFSGLTGTIYLCGGGQGTGTKAYTLLDLSDAAYTTYPAPSGFTEGWGTSSVNLNVTALKAALAISGKPATINTTRGSIVTPAKAALIISGKPATIVASTNVALTASRGSVVVAGRAAAFTASPVLAPGKGALAIAGKPATIATSSNATLSPALGGIQITGRPAVIETGAPLFVTPSAGALAVQGKPATVVTTQGVILQPARGTVQIQGKAATVVEGQGINLTPAKGAVAIAGKLAVVVTGVPGIVTALAGQIQVSGKAATVRGDARVTAAKGALVVQGKPATITAQTNAILAPVAARVAVTGKAATLVKTDNIVLFPGSRRVNVYGHPAWMQTSDNGGRVVIADPPPDRGGRSWRDIVMDVDPDWAVKYRSTEGSYEFSNGRRFG